MNAHQSFSGSCTRTNWPLDGLFLCCLVKYLCLSYFWLASASFASADPFSNVRPSQFQGLTPGVSRFEHVKEKFDSDHVTGTGDVWKIEIGAPFRWVQLKLNGSRPDDQRVVESLEAILIRPRSYETTVSELGLGELQPQMDRDGERRFHYFAERGIRLYLSDPTSKHVESIELRSLDLRDVLQHHGLGDGVANEGAPDGTFIDSEIQLLTSLAERHHLDSFGRIRLLQWYLRAGQVEKATELLAELRKNNELGDGEFRARVLQARLNLWTGEPVSVSDLEPPTKTKGLVAVSEKLSIARLYSLPQVGAQAKAAHLVTAAIEGLQPLLESPQDGSARWSLLEAHVVMVQAIASGPWEDKSARLGQWLSNTATLMQVVETPSDRPLYKVEASRRILESLAKLDYETDYEPWASAARKAAQAASSQPAVYIQSELALELARIHRSLSQLARNHGALDRALDEAMKSRQFLDQVKHPLLTRRHQIEQTETRFLLSAIHAIGKKDHTAAIRWYEQAEPHFSKIDPESFGPGTIGDRLISIGVSYWALGEKQRALDITEQGRKRIEEFVAAERIPKKSLATAFRNLSVIYAGLGREQESAEFVEMARSLEIAGKQR
jgi:tetratricopeptide (TPR) repeat protein